MYNIEVRIKESFYKENDDDSDVYPTVKAFDYVKDELDFSTGKYYIDGKPIFENDTITAFKMPIGKVEWCNSDHQWIVRITDFPSGSMSIGSTKPLKEFFNPVKV